MNPSAMDVIESATASADERLTQGAAECRDDDQDDEPR